MSTSIVIAVIGAKALWLTYAWLASAIIASFLSNRAGFGEKWGLASGLLLNFVGVIIWLVIWLVVTFTRGDKTAAQARMEQREQEEAGT